MRYVVIQQTPDGFSIALITHDLHKANYKAEKITQEDNGLFGYVLTYDREVPIKRLIIRE